MPRRARERRRRRQRFRVSRETGLGPYQLSRAGGAAALTSSYQRCIRCVMDTSDPEIVFDDAGVCNHCTSWFAKLNRLRSTGRFGPEQLQAVVARLKAAGRGRRYDAVLGVSGGADSTYLAWKLHELGVRVLLVHVDNGWNSPEATRNISRLANRLGLDYESYVLDWDEFRDIQLAFLKASVAEAETPTDLALSGALHRVAARHGLKYVILGSNEVSEGILPRLWHYDAKDVRYFKAIQRRFGTRRIRHFPSFGAKEEIYYKFVRGIRFVYMLNYLDYDKAAATALLKSEIGWQDYGGKHHESEFTRFIQSYLLPKKFDLDYRKATLSSMICAGQVSREAALKELERPPFDPVVAERQKAYIAKKLGISLAELEALIDAPGRTYREFPNNEKWLTRLYAAYRRWFS
ncbi:MAG: N-acetyl sugar amidotransferase [Sphingosinicella sp.]